MDRGARARRGSRAAICLAMLMLGGTGCSFDPRGGVGGGGGGDSGPSDDGGPAGPDAEVTIDCTPAERLCFGHRIETCNQSGDGFLEEESVSCALSCEPNGGDPLCTAPSNIPAADAADCAGNAPALTPTSGTVSFTVSGGVERITCSDDCGGGLKEIVRAAAISQGGDPDIAWFCLSRLAIPDGVTVKVDVAVTRSVALLIAGDVSIEGSITVDGGGASGGGAGSGGAGGGGGAPPAATDSDGSSGGGRCPGTGGGRATGDGVVVGAGGGGGGYGGVGGDGGDGISGGGAPSNDGTTVAGAVGGANSCDGDASLVPLVGGGGGGSGADGECGGDCGRAGGGGGGALQISARGRFEVSGALSALGGGGFGDATGNLSRGGAGGGGAGGAILLEAPVLVLSGSFVVIGGPGGLAGAGLGGDGGGSGTRVGVANGANGADADADAEGGAGGGGAAGRVRLNALAEPTCPAGVTPPPSCRTGALRTVPDPF